MMLKKNDETCFLVQIQTRKFVATYYLYKIFIYYMSRLHFNKSCMSLEMFWEIFIFQHVSSVLLKIKILILWIIKIFKNDQIFITYSFKCNLFYFIILIMLHIIQKQIKYAKDLEILFLLETGQIIWRNSFQETRNFHFK